VSVLVQMATASTAGSSSIDATARCHATPQRRGGAVRRRLVDVEDRGRRRARDLLREQLRMQPADPADAITPIATESIGLSARRLGRAAGGRGTHD